MKKILVALFALVLSTVSAFADAVRVYFGFGQLGRGTSLGIVQLANKVGKLDKNIITSQHGFAMGYLAQTIYDDVMRQKPTTKIVFVMYSLSVGAGIEAANAMPKRKIDLFIAYDPSRFQTLRPVPANVQRVKLYHNRCAAIWGGSYVVGPQVVMRQTCNFHLAMDFDPALHADSIAEIKRLLK